MKKSLMMQGIVIVLFGALVLPVATMAEESRTVKGEIVKLTCPEKKELRKIYDCPVDQADPRLDGETDFILVAGDGARYYLPNVPHHLKAKNSGVAVTVTGKVHPQYQSVIVDKITEAEKIIWCRREVIWNENALYPVPVPDLCSL